MDDKETERESVREVVMQVDSKITDTTEGREKWMQVMW